VRIRKSERNNPKLTEVYTKFFLGQLGNNYIFNVFLVNRTRNKKSVSVVFGLKGQNQNIEPFQPSAKKAENQFFYRHNPTRKSCGFWP